MAAIRGGQRGGVACPPHGVDARRRWQRPGDLLYSCQPCSRSNATPSALKRGRPVSTWPLTGKSLRTRRLVPASTVALGVALFAYILYSWGSHRVWRDLQAIGWRFVPIVA